MLLNKIKLCTNYKQKKQNSKGRRSSLPSTFFGTRNRVTNKIITKTNVRVLDIFLSLSKLKVEYDLMIL